MAAPLASRYEAVLLDLDGVLRRGDAPVAGAGDTVRRLLDAGLEVAYVTNNAAATPAQVADELRAFGIPADASRVVTSSLAAAALLDPGTRCLVIGMEGLRQALRERGCAEVTEPAGADAVVVGFDRGVRWDDLRRATIAIAGGARFVATNTDATFPAAGEVWPGNGAVVAALRTATGVAPEVAGKPHAPLLRRAAELVGVSQPLMVGDRHETDVAGAAALGWDTALVLTGVTSASDVPHLSPAPTYVLDSVADLLRPAPPRAPALQLRAATPGDVDAIIELWDEAGMLSYTPRAREELEVLLRRDPSLLVVADDGGRVIGVAMGSSDGRRGWLMRVAVAPEHRSRGIGARIVGEVERRMAARGVPQVNLLVFDANEGGKRFWARLGYRQTSPVAMFVKALDAPGGAGAC